MKIAFDLFETWTVDLLLCSKILVNLRYQFKLPSRINCSKGFPFERRAHCGTHTIMAFNHWADVLTSSTLPDPQIVKEIPYVAFGRT
jgi:hypothetical protein